MTCFSKALAWSTYLWDMCDVDGGTGELSVVRLLGCLECLVSFTPMWEFATQNPHTHPHIFTVGIGMFYKRGTKNSTKFVINSGKTFLILGYLIGFQNIYGVPIV